MYPVLFQIAGFQIRTYSLMLLLAFVVGIILLWLILKRRTLIDPAVVSDFAFWVIIGVVVGARLAYVFMHWPEFADNPASIFKIWEGGAVYYGGFILALAAGLIYLRVKKIPVLPLLDAIAPVIALCESIGRIGCFLNGCCFGKPTDVCGIAFAPGSIPYVELVNAGELPQGVLSAVVWPTQLFQSGGGILLFVILFLLMRLVRLRKGQLFAIFLAGLGAFRFGVNFLRYYEDTLNLWTNNWIAIGLVIVGVGLAIYFGRTQEKVPTPQWVAAERKKMAEARRKKEQGRSKKSKKSKKASRRR